jgi:hypothetical protein
MTLAPATLSKTILYAAELPDPKGGVLHTLGYGNTAVSVGPNAMLLPIPSKTPMGPENIIDTRSAKNFLKDMVEAITPKTRGFARSLGVDGLTKGIQVFDSGSYTVVLAEDASAIPSALGFVPMAKRPKINQDIFDAYARLYPNSQFALCCWSGLVDAEPLLWWYKPTDTENLFLPGLDGHDGRAPNLNADVTTDHALIVGTELRAMSQASPVHYTDWRMGSNVTPYLATRVAGMKTQRSMRNGDWYFPIRNFSRLGYEGQNTNLFERVVPGTSWAIEAQ